MTALRRELRLAAIPLLLGTALVAAGTAAARFARDAGAANETLLLALWAALALAPLAWESLRPGTRRNGARLALSAAALATTLVVALLPRAGASRPAAVALLLVLALATAATTRLAARPPISSASAAAFALSFTMIAHGPRLWIEPLAPAALGFAILLPAFSAAVAWNFGRRGDGSRGALAGCALLLAPLVAREPWPILLALATLAALAWSSPPVSRFARPAFGTLAVLALLAGSFPWIRPAPVSTVLAALLAVPHPEQDLAGRTLNLTAASPVLELPLDGGPLARLRLDTYLTNSTALPCGTPLASVVLEGGGLAYRAELVVGRDSAEWAADRPDVARSLACAPPPAWVRFVPAEGRFFGRFSRAVLRPPTTVYPDRLRIERHDALPDDLALSIFDLVTVR